MFAKFYVSRGEKLPARYSTFEKSEAFVFGTAEEAESFASGLFRKDAGPAVAVAIAKPEQYIHGYAASSIPGYDPSMRRPSRHDIEEAMIHGAHELYS